jgi:hypothetical protein
MKMFQGQGKVGEFGKKSGKISLGQGIFSLGLNL